MNRHGYQVLNSLRKQGKLSEKDVKDWLVNPIRRVEYEIQNMFTHNNRTTNGQISIFVPVLHKDMLASDFERIHVTPDKINTALQELLAIDYSVFDHEVIYSNEEAKIVKEYMIKRVFPDIILMPTVGVNGIMWQEITGRKDTSGVSCFRYLQIQSVISNGKSMRKILWECRTIEGTAWNDISINRLLRNIQIISILSRE